MAITKKWHVYKWEIEEKHCDDRIVKKTIKEVERYLANNKNIRGFRVGAVKDFSLSGNIECVIRFLKYDEYKCDIVYKYIDRKINSMIKDKKTKARISEVSEVEGILNLQNAIVRCE